MNIVVTGGLGFVGRHLTQSLTERGDRIVIVDRSAGRRPVPEGVRCIAEDLSEAGQWQQAVRDADAVVNLVGTSIFRRWTKKAKAAIRDSRVQSTRNVVDALGKDVSNETALVNASAVGIYGFRGDEVVDEDGEAGDDFLARVAVDWENEALRARERGSRVVLCRFGIVLGRGGGAMDMMLPLFRWMLGARLGPGDQWFSWIHIRDLVDILIRSIDNPDFAGPVNCTAPHPVTNSEFTDVLASVVGRPVLFPFVPAFMLRMLYGEFGSVLVNGQRAVPRKLRDMGFCFSFPELHPALEEIVGEA